MRERTIRALGASSILGLIALAVIFNPGPPETSAEVQAPVATSASSEAEPSTTTSSTTTTIPFHYRVGVLAAPSTSNFWAFYGGEATVWDAYVLGPTKPALYGLDPETSRLRPELVAGESVPVEDSDGWHVDVDLRTDMAWSDGTPITAEDLVFTFTTIRELNLGGGWFVLQQCKDGIGIKDDHFRRSAAASSVRARRRARSVLGPRLRYLPRSSSIGSFGSGRTTTRSPRSTTTT